IAVLDGSWGVLIQKRVRGEDEYRGERFRDHPLDVAGNPDLLNLTQPDIVREIHRSYFAAGADIATTNTFTATRIGQADYALQDVAAEMSLEGAKLAREVADEFGGLVAGSVGPLNVSLSLSPRVDDPAYRSATFDEVVEAYADQIRALRDGGAAALALLHRRGQERPQPVGPDGRGVLDLGRARGAARGGRQLLARRRRDAALRRGPRRDRADLGRMPSERRAAERARRAR